MHDKLAHYLRHPQYHMFRKILGFSSWFYRVAPVVESARPLLPKESYDHLMMIAHGSGWEYRKAMRGMAEFLCHAGLPDHGLAIYEALLATYPSREAVPEWLAVSYLQMLMFGSPEIQTNEHIYKQHVFWSQCFIQGKPYTHYDNPRTLNRRIKIAYTCHFISSSTSLTLLQNLLFAHHRDRVEVFMYSDEPKETVSDSVRGIVEHWRDTYGMSHDDFCELLRKDGVDILFELNGQGLANRYPVIARHPVPIQVAWYNYACTTGVPGMDYVLTSDDIEIEDLQPYYSETIFRKKGAYHALSVGSHFPPVSPPAFEKNGFITFCSFGQAHKVSRTQIALWCEILKQVEGSKFFMKAQMLGYAPNRAAFIQHFKDGGIDESRLIMEGNSDYATLLRCYERVDIALDTYPFNGGTTTVEATIQGIPTICLIGERFSSQMARQNLESGGHPEFLCKSREEFIEKAVSMAKDPARLASLRQMLREDFRRSPRGNVERFTTELEDACQEMWKRFIASSQEAAA